MKGLGDLRSPSQSTTTLCDFSLLRGNKFIRTHQKKKFHPLDEASHIGTPLFRQLFYTQITRVIAVAESHQNSMSTRPLPMISEVRCPVQPKILSAVQRLLDLIDTMVVNS